jgi:Ni,Fe-hydrogenase maturation factor
MTGRIIVLACGDELRGDDGVAVAAVGALLPAILARAEVRIVGAVAVEDLVALPVGSRVVIVDAVAGPAPGQLVEFELAALHGRAHDPAAPDAGASAVPDAEASAAPDAEASAAPAHGPAAPDAEASAAPDAAAMHTRAPGAPAVGPTSSHQLPLPEVVALAGLLRDAPLEGRFVGVGIKSVAFGSGLSEAVAAAVPALAEAVARAVRALG